MWSHLCSFYSRFESTFPLHLFEDIYTHLNSLDLASTESAPKEEEWTPDGEEIAVKLNILAGSNYFCSSAVDSYTSDLVKTLLTIVWSVHTSFTIG